MSWESVDVQRSVLALPWLILSSTGGGASTQPMRMPGERIFENVPRYITNTPPSSE